MDRQTRITRAMMFLEMAEAAAKRSTCFRGNIGAILVKDRNIISIGYNGPPTGWAHCTGHVCDQKSTGGCARSIHAEVNDLRRSLKRINLGCTLYCTHSPCLDCAKEIVKYGIERVYFRHSYRDPSGLHRLLNEAIATYQVTPAGFLINMATGQIIEDQDG